MNITETRKYIIELIEPYMDKTLSEWCIINVNWDYFKLNQDNEWYLFYYNNWKKILYKHNIDKIIWHYYITAVFKYISKKIPVISIGDERIHSHLYKDWIWCSDVNIPNKPLPLYTEEEDNNLFKLFKKIW